MTTTRWLVLLVFTALVVTPILLLAGILARAARRLGRAAGPGARGHVVLDPETDSMPAIDAVREMVADPVCGAFVAKQSALTTISGGKTWFFCSSNCYRNFLLEHRRASGQ